LIQEDFYRCAACDHGEFVLEKRVVLKLDPPGAQDYITEEIQGIALNVRYVYRCSNCGEELKRTAGKKG
jgi:hypothetical protein